MRPSRLWIYRLITALLPETRFFGLKVRLLRWCGAQIGSNVRINSSARFAGDGQLIIGDDVWIGPGNLLSAVGSATLTIGSHCDLAPQVTLLTGTHMVGGGYHQAYGRPWLCTLSLHWRRLLALRASPHPTRRFPGQANHRRSRCGCDRLLRRTARPTRRHAGENRQALPGLLNRVLLLSLSSPTRANPVRAELFCLAFS